ncbi:hypothetical protein ACJMK2_024136 [Sinanodonta woodiana]|uniref:Uncharacterized protein n=1 Tax=Sinanodonta woodiana TaxID=1069815 RepID=A0ABD3T6P0_SINWO
MEWRCAVRGKANTCPVDGKQRREIFTFSHHSHTHPSMPGSLIAVKMKSMLKTLAFGDMFVSAPATVDYILHAYADPWKPEHSRPVSSKTVRICNRARQTMRPSDSHDLSFEVISVSIIIIL